MTEVEPAYIRHGERLIYSLVLGVRNDQTSSDDTSKPSPADLVLPGNANHCCQLISPHLVQPEKQNCTTQLHLGMTNREFAAFIIFLSFIVYIYTSIVLFRHITHNRND